MKMALGFMRHNLNNQYEHQKFIDYALKNGVNVFETCYFYLDYKCEDYIYSLLSKYKREEYILIGKMPVKNIINHQNFKDIFNKQIEKVPEHYFDIYEIQAIDSTCLYDLYNTGILPFLLQKKKEGYFKKLGLNIQCDPDTLKNLLKLNCWDILQMPINPFDWQYCLGEELYNVANEFNIPIIAQAPLKGGLLSDINNTIKLYEQLNNIQYILTGTSSIKHLSLWLNAFNQNEKSYKPLPKLKSISCINCRLCISACPNKIPIGWIFQMYNKAIQNKQDFLNFALYKQFANEPIHNCIQCSKCEQICPQQLDIIHLFQNEIFELRL